MFTTNLYNFSKFLMVSKTVCRPKLLKGNQGCLRHRNVAGCLRHRNVARLRRSERSPQCLCLTLAPGPRLAPQWCPPALQMGTSTLARRAWLMHLVRNPCRNRSSLERRRLPKKRKARMARTRARQTRASTRAAQAGARAGAGGGAGQGAGARARPGARGKQTHRLHQRLHKQTRRLHHRQRTRNTR